MNKDEILLQTDFALKTLRLLGEVIGEYDSTLEEEEETDKKAKNDRLTIKKAHIYLEHAAGSIRQAHTILSKLSD